MFHSTPSSNVYRASLFLFVRFDHIEEWRREIAEYVLEYVDILLIQLAPSALCVVLCVCVCKITKSCCKRGLARGMSLLVAVDGPSWLQWCVDQCAVQARAGRVWAKHAVDRAH